MHSAAAEYTPFRRPQTPEHQRPYDHRATTAGPSPRGSYSTPDIQRYGTPQSYHSRHPSAAADTGSDPGRMSTGPNTPASHKPPFGNLPRAMDLGRAPPDDPYARRDDGRQAPDYNPDRSAAPRHYPFDDRYRLERDRTAPAPDQRERQGRDRSYSGGEPRHHGPPELNPRNQPSYGRPPDHMDRREPPRDQHWGRPGGDPNHRPPMDPQRPHADYPPASAYPRHNPPYQSAPSDRYPPTSHPQPHAPATGPPNGPPQPYDVPGDRASLERLHPGRRSAEEQQPPQHPQGYAGQHAPPSHAYDPARNRTGEDPAAPIQQRNLLGVQDMNRKGRMSPLPQAVQGAQPQQPGPAGEPGIKSEFGRMFAGIGSGVGAMGGSSPVTSSASAAYGGTSQPKREETNGEFGAEGAKGGKPRRRKLKEEEGKGDDDGSGRLTPSGRGAKRPKGHHHHQYVSPTEQVRVQTDRILSHHHHHHHHAPDSVSSPLVGITPLKPGKSTPAAEPPADKAPAGGAHHHHHHHHHHHAGKQARSVTPQPKPEVEAPVIPPKTKTVVKSNAVLESVAQKPRLHLGDVMYESVIKTGRLLPNTPTNRGFASKPKPLPLDLIKGKENSVLTVKVPLVHLTPVAREEITARAFLWGTDVYSDDSDVVAACIHGGWIMGEWTDDVDTAMLNLDNSEGKDGKDKSSKAKAHRPELDSEGLITGPPAAGPLPIPANRDLHVNLLILPRLVKYSSSTRFGMTSREFGGTFGARHAVHDGLSYMIKSIRWVENGGQLQARLRGQARRERMRKAMREVKVSFGNISGQERELEKERIGRLRSEITGNWWKKDGQPEADGDAANDKQRAGSEGDKENRVGEGEAAQEAKAEAAAVDKDVDMGDAGEEIKATEEKASA